MVLGVLAAIAPREARADDAQGVVLGLDVGIGACPSCLEEDAGALLGGRVAYRLPVGLRLGGFLFTLAADSQDPGACPEGVSCVDVREQGLLVLAGAEVGYHPLRSGRLRFDPYVALGVAYGTGSEASTNGVHAAYDGLVLLPRAGALFVVSDKVSVGGSLGRTFGFWRADCGGPADAQPKGCADDGGPTVWATGIEAVFTP